MKNIILALVCLFTFSFKGIAGNNDPKCCTDKCSKQCIEMCKKNNCTDKDCCKNCDTKGCAGSACAKDQSSCCKKAEASVGKTTNATTAKADNTMPACCKKTHK